MNLNSSNLTTTHFSKKHCSLKRSVKLPVLAGKNKKLKLIIVLASFITLIKTKQKAVCGDKWMNSSTHHIIGFVLKLTMRPTFRSYSFNAETEANI